MIPHLFYQIYPSFLEQNDCTPPKCDELSEYTDSAHTEVEDLSSRYMNGSNVYDRCGHDTRLLHPSCTACRYTGPTGESGFNRGPVVQTSSDAQRLVLWILQNHVDF